MKKILFGLWFFFLLSVHGVLFAQDDKYEISTDRPSISFSAFTVPKGIFLAETGYYWQTDKTELRADSTFRNNFSTLPNISLRYGLFENIEIRIGWDYRRSNNITEQRIGNVTQRLESAVQGVGALTLGTKIKMLENKGAIPQMSFLGAIQLPAIADKNFKTDYIGQYFRFLCQNQLNDKFFLFYNLGADFGASPNGKPQTTGAYTFALGSSLASGLTGFVELFGFLPEHSADYHSIDAGLVYIINKQFQFDTSFGYGLTQYAPDYFFNVGFSFYVK
ncbi:MAG: transporter [Microscillaceae bacterium]|nr:transporter [Microscillaceae bacterium]MDW8460955.1 transporter [Cytophagales bacterium]